MAALFMLFSGVKGKLHESRELPFLLSLPHLPFASGGPHISRRVGEMRYPPFPSENYGSCLRHPYGRTTKRVGGAFQLHVLLGLFGSASIAVW